MADLSQHRSLHYRRVPAARSAEPHGHWTAILTGGLLAVLAAAGWLWLRQPPAASPLPSSSPSEAVLSEVAPAPVHPAAIHQVPAPPSADLAAVGDTRPLKP